MGLSCQSHESHCRIEAQGILDRQAGVCRRGEARARLVPRYIAGGLGEAGRFKQQFGNASILRDGRVVFNIGGNKYRIVVWINYPYRVVYIRFIGTHAQYDAIDAQAV
jgi:mRNA interferase HigB